jgi:hypothetical protein
MSIGRQRNLPAALRRIEDLVALDINGFDGSLSVRLPDHNESPFIEGDSHELPYSNSQDVGSLEQRQAERAGGCIYGSSLRLLATNDITPRMRPAGTKSCSA